MTRMLTCEPVGMASSKRPSTKGGSPTSVGAMVSLAAAAIEVLKRPEVRAELLTYSKAAAEAVQSWRQKRPAERAEAGEGAGVQRAGLAESFGEHFGQRKLELRARHVRELVVSLGATSSTVAEALQPVGEGIDQIDSALHVSARLPIVKRKLAHRQIDEQLDSFEKALLAAAMPTSSPTPDSTA